MPHVDVSPELISLVRVLMALATPAWQQRQQGGFGNQSLSTRRTTTTATAGVRWDADGRRCGRAQHPGAPVPESVRAFAFVALGKLCLVDQNLAKVHHPARARDLPGQLRRRRGQGSDSSNGNGNGNSNSNKPPPSPAVQSNALLVLGDLCVRYTSLVERHIPALAQYQASTRCCAATPAAPVAAAHAGLPGGAACCCTASCWPTWTRTRRWPCSRGTSSSSPSQEAAGPARVGTPASSTARGAPQVPGILLQGGEGTAASAVDFKGVDLSDRAPLEKHVEADSGGR